MEKEERRGGREEERKLEVLKDGNNQWGAAKQTAFLLGPPKYISLGPWHHLKGFHQDSFQGASLVVQWLRLCNPNAECSVLVRELDPTCFSEDQRFQVLQLRPGAAQQMYINFFFKRTYFIWNQELPMRLKPLCSHCHTQPPTTPLTPASKLTII